MVGSIQDKTYDYLAKVGEELSNFYYLGPKSPPEVNGILMNALFLVHTCDPEGFPGNMIQAWLLGKPTISLYFDPEGIIEREKIGYLARTFLRFEEQTRYLIENESARIEMGGRAQAYAKQHFNSDANVHQLETFLFDIINENGYYQKVGV
jgi:glycosyltransferase involved in cell wall biosynthesis